MCYEVEPDNVDRVGEVADRFDLGCSVIGEVTDGNYRCTFEGRDCRRRRRLLPRRRCADERPPDGRTGDTGRDLPADVDLTDVFESIVGGPNTASSAGSTASTTTKSRSGHRSSPGTTRGCSRSEKRTRGWRSPPAPTPTGQTPRRTGAPAPSRWRTPPTSPRRGPNRWQPSTASTAATPKPEVYGAFNGIVDGLADMCSTLDVPVVGGNVSLYNDSVAGPIPPTPTLALAGTKQGYEAPPMGLSGEGTLLLVAARALEGTRNPPRRVRLPRPVRWDGPVPRTPPDPLASSPLSPTSRTRRARSRPTT